jgi:hypothetical protein
MPIIIDNFHVRIDAPIDNRFVVGGVDSFYQDKNDIEHKYLGLRIWDLNTPGGPFCWKGDIEGWVSENAIGVTVDGTTSAGYLPVFTSGPTVLGNSLLFQTNNQIGIGILPGSINPNTQVNDSAISFTSNGLHVSGNIKTNNYLIGKGDYITQLNASNVNAGLLDIRYISHLQSNGSGLSSAQYVLSNTGLNSGVTWKLANTLSVANADISNKITITDELNSSTIHYITFALGIGDQQLKINSSKIQFKPSTGQLFLSDGNAGAPVYSFLSGVSTGFYYNYSPNGNVVPSTIGGIGTSIEGQEITRTNRNGLVVNNRIYIQPTSNNLSDVGYGIVWLLNGATNDQLFNDGFEYNTQRLNFYGIGSHIPTESSEPTGRGTYIAGYFGVDVFSGSRLKVKVDQHNDVNIFSRLNINTTGIDGMYDRLGSSINENRVLLTIKSTGGIAGNSVVIKDWSVRASQAQTPNASSQDSWLTWKHHNGITIDGVYNTPNGPAKISGPDSPTYGTLTFWERHPYLHEQYLGSADRKTLTINSSVNNTGGLTSFVKVNGNIYNVTGNPFIGTYSVVSTKTLEDVLNNNLPKTIKTGMFDINGTSMYSTVPNSSGKFQIITVNDNDFANYLKWIEIPYNAPELNNVAAGQTSYIGTNGSIEPLDNEYNSITLSGVTNVAGRARYDTYGIRNSFQQAWHNIKGYKVFQINQRGSGDSRFKVLMYKDPAYIADFNSGKLTEWKLEKNAAGVSVAYGGIGNGGRYDFLLICPSWRPIPTYFMNQPGMSHVEIYIHEPTGEYQDMALYINLQRRSVLVPTTLNTNLPGVPLGSYTGI